MPSPPLPDPGEPPAVDPGPGAGSPVTPLPNPGEGGPVYPGGNRPVFPGIILPPVQKKYARVRILNAGYGYRPFRILINNTRVVNWLGYAAFSPYGRVPAGYQTVTVTGMDGYVYIQKSLPFEVGQIMTIAIINTPSGLDLLQIPDNCCRPNGNFANFRVSNLALNSPPVDVLLGDGRVVYSDVRCKETTPFKRIRPGAYQFFFAETALAPMPSWMDIETLDSAFIGTYPLPNTLASLYLNAANSVSYTAYLIPGSPTTIQVLLAETR